MDAALRRILDVAVAAVALVLLAPALLSIATWIRLDSPGPALFRQERVGRGGRIFRIHKFRTMREAAESPGPSRERRPPPQVTVADDPRITRAGALLRRSKLDELPQLIDVLRGEMSLVGPRPEVPHWVAEWPEAMRAALLATRPGLTDPASIAFADEQDRLAAAADPEREYREVILPAKLALSARYLAQRTVASDLRLLVATAARLLRRGPVGAAPPRQP